MMTANELYALLGAAAVLVGGAWALVKLTVAQFDRRLDERFVALAASRTESRNLWDERFKTIAARQGLLETALSTLQRTLPIDYTRREDAIRADVQVNAKLDAINNRLDRVLTQRRQEDHA